MQMPEQNGQLSVRFWAEPKILSVISDSCYKKKIVTISCLSGVPQTKSISDEQQHLYQFQVKDTKTVPQAM